MTNKPNTATTDQPAQTSQKTSRKPNYRLAGLNKILNLYTVIGMTFWLVAIVLILVPSFPYIWYRINGDATETEINTITEPLADTSEFEDKTEPEDLEEEPTAELPEPEFDPNLSESNTLIIPSIGVNGFIHESQDPEGALKNGIWRVPEYGTPEDDLAIIIAAHRFGYIFWSNDFRQTNSFYNLPKTGVGDKVEIVWGQRKYVYEIYRVEDATAVTDYDADLILYTCQMWNSPVRVFRYAERVE